MDQSTVPLQMEQKRLMALSESAAQHAAEANQRAVQVSVDIGKEKTQYFEKIALACAGTIALVVSFVGSHAGRLQPRVAAAFCSRCPCACDDCGHVSELEVSVLSVGLPRTGGLHCEATERAV